MFNLLFYKSRTQKKHIFSGFQSDKNDGLALRKHTDVNDPLLGGRLACMPVIPEAELHLWALVILKHSHHDRLKWRKKGDRRRSRELGTLVELNVNLSPACVPAFIYHSKSPFSPHVVIGYLQ